MQNYAEQLVVDAYERTTEDPERVKRRKYSELVDATKPGLRIPVKSAANF